MGCLWNQESNPKEGQDSQTLEKCGDEDLKQEFKLLKRQVQKDLRRLYWRHIENIISDDITNPTSSKKKFWSFIKARRTEGMGMYPLKDNGKLITNPKDKPNFSITSFVLCSVPDILLLLRSFNNGSPQNQTFPSTQTGEKNQHYWRRGEETAPKLSL